MKKLILILCLVLLNMLPVSANSGPVTWIGSDATGTVLIDEDCPVEVVHEKLTFTIFEFPEISYNSFEEYQQYQACMQAEYTLSNPTDMKIAAHLLFPIGSNENYSGYYDTDMVYHSIQSDESTHQILLNEQPIDYQVRYSPVSAYPFDFERESSQLYDGYREDEFFKPDMQVTRQIYQVTNVNIGFFDEAVAAFELPASYKDTVFVFEELNSWRTDEETMVAGLFLESDLEVEMLLIGEPLELDWTVYKNGAMDEMIEGELSLISSETLTFEELVMSTYGEETGILKHDWYNIVVNGLSHNEQPFCDVHEFQVYPASLMKWYDYSIEIEPQFTVVHTVSAPVYPSIHLNYEPSKYTYSYLLSPARNWQAFQDLEIEILTDFYLIDSSLSGFEKTDQGYELHLKKLPKQELTFQLSRSETPSKTDSFHFSQISYFLISVIYFLVPVAGIVLLILFFVKSRIER